MLRALAARGIGETDHDRKQDDLPYKQDKKNGKQPFPYLGGMLHGIPLSANAVKIQTEIPYCFGSYASLPDRGRGACVYPGEIPRPPHDGESVGGMLHMNQSIWVTVVAIAIVTVAALLCAAWSPR